MNSTEEVTTRDAIYRLCEGGKSYYYYARRGGDWQTVFDAIQCLQNIGLTPLHFSMDRLVYSPDYPDDIVEYDDGDENGPYVFEPATPEQRKAGLSPRSRPVCGFVTLDFDRAMVEFEPNPGCPIPDPINTSRLEIPMEAGLKCALESAQTAIFKMSSEPLIKTLNWLLAAKLPLLAATWEASRGRNAIYTLREDGREHYYHSDFCGGYLNPVAVLDTLQKARVELGELGLFLEHAAVIQGIRWPLDHWNLPRHCQGAPMFEQLDKEQFRRELGRLDTCEAVAQHVILDFEAEQLTIRRSRWVDEQGGELCAPFQKLEGLMPQLCTASCEARFRELEQSVSRSLRRLSLSEPAQGIDGHAV